MGKVGRATAAFWGLLFIYCIWIFSLPLFPTQDGPLHLYYVHVIERLLEGSAQYSSFFEIRHPIPPYAIHYLLLLTFGKVFSPLVAEKCIVCLIVLLFATALRQLLKAVHGNQMLSLLGIPLSLNWMVGMGFHNFCLSVALSLWAAVTWLKAAETRKVSLFSGFAMFSFLVLFSHPVPLLFVVAFSLADLARRYLQSEGSPIDRVRGLSADLIFAAVPVLGLLYVALFLNIHQTSENLHHALIQRGMLLDFVKMRPLMLTSGTVLSWLYWALLVAVLLGALWTGGKGIRGSLSWKALTVPHLLLGGATLLLILYPILPRTINGADFFADRLVIYIWVCAIAGASCYLPLSSLQERRLLIGAAAMALLALVNAELALRPVAKRISSIESATLHAPGLHGIYIDAPVIPDIERLTFNPYIWSEARYFRRSDTVMLNAPWLALPTLPVAPTRRSLSSQLPAKVLNSPDEFAGLVIRSAEARDLVAKDLDFILFVGWTSKDPAVVDNVLAQNWGRTWDCKRDDWYAVCASDVKERISQPADVSRRGL